MYHLHQQLRPQLHHQLRLLHLLQAQQEQLPLQLLPVQLEALLQLLLQLHPLEVEEPVQQLLLQHQQVQFSNTCGDVAHFPVACRRLDAECLTNLQEGLLVPLQTPNLHIDCKQHMHMTLHQPTRLHICVLLVDRIRFC